VQKYPLLDTIRSPRDVKRLEVEKLPQLASELRSFLLETVHKTGGHLASNLGVVELTIALVYVYDFPFDKIVWDVGHQSYVYKILTGRKERMSALRARNGICGFPDALESRYDFFNTGHSSTSISAALGMARARDLNKGKNQVLAVIGDGAMTGGMAWEAINDLASEKTPLVVVLNDNNMSIDRNIGGLSRYLSRVRMSKSYVNFKAGVLRFTRKSKPLYRALKRFRDGLKFRMVHGKLFEQMGLKYIGPIDGHSITDLVAYFELAKEYSSSPLLVHVVTKKGKGDADAESDPQGYHGISPVSAQKNQAFSGALGQSLIELARDDGRVVAVTAAMAQGTGLSLFADVYPTRFFDVAIAEQHAVTMSAGMAMAGKRPFVAVYSTFMQRAYDQVLHDVCLQDLPVVFCMDRAGIADGDGATHAGLYDTAFLDGLPNLKIFAPKNAVELDNILRWTLTQNHPVAIRYPKGQSVCYSDGSRFDPNEPCAWEIVRKAKVGQGYAIVASPDFLDLALRRECGVIYATCVSSVDEKLLSEICERAIVCVGDYSISPLFAKISTYYATHNSKVLLDKAILDTRLVKSGSKNEILASFDFEV